MGTITLRTPGAVPVTAGTPAAAASVRSPLGITPPSGVVLRSYPKWRAGPMYGARFGI